MSLPKVFSVLSKKSVALCSTALSLLGLAACSEGPLNEEQLHRIYSKTAPTPAAGINVYHLGHSLVGRDMPAMLQQLAGEGHDYRSQLGWGATLQSHWDPEIPIGGFKEENAHDKYEDVFKAIKSQRFEAIVLTEMVEIKDAIKYFDSAKYVENFARYIHENSPRSAIYLYESWHEVNDPRGWLVRLDEDYNKYWINQILDPALRKLEGKPSIYVIPVGQVMSAFFKALTSKDLPGNVKAPEDIFARTDEGKLDPIHINDIGEYLVALVHYSVIYQKSPQGLPHQLKRADGSDAKAPSEQVAALMQEVTWNVVKQNFRTGITAYKK